MKTTHVPQFAREIRTASREVNPPHSINDVTR